MLDIKTIRLLYSFMFLIKRNNSCDFLIASLDDKTLPKGVLQEQIFPSKGDPLTRGGINESGIVASPENFADMVYDLPRPQGYKTFFMLNSAEINFFLHINVEMPTIVGISTFMCWKNSIQGLSEPEKCSIS